MISSFNMPCKSPLVDGVDLVLRHCSVSLYTVNFYRITHYGVNLRSKGLLVTPLLDPFYLLSQGWVHILYDPLCMKTWSCSWCCEIHSLKKEKLLVFSNSTLKYILRLLGKKNSYCYDNFHQSMNCYWNNQSFELIWWNWIRTSTGENGRSSGVKGWRRVTSREKLLICSSWWWWLCD